MLVQGVQDHIDGLAAELNKLLKKELQESGALCQAQFAELCNQLADNKAQITAKTEMYQQAGSVPTLHDCLCRIDVMFGHVPQIFISMKNH